MDSLDEFDSATGMLELNFTESVTCCTVLNPYF